VNREGKRDPARGPLAVRRLRPGRVPGSGPGEALDNHFNHPGPAHKADLSRIVLVGHTSCNE